MSDSVSAQTPIGPALDTRLVDALRNRRSRRFAPGMRLNGGALAYESTQPPSPLSIEEQAALAFAACGITGNTYGDLPFETGVRQEAGGGNILMQLVGRTAPSPDAAHANVVFVIDDTGTWLLKRPRDFNAAEVAELVALGRQGELVEVYERSRVRIADRRLMPATEVPFTLPFNKWSANQPGTTTFLPVMDLSGFAINVALAAFSEESAYFVVDDHNWFLPAGLAKFGRSKGGHLYDDPKKGRTATVGMGGNWVFEFAAIEQGAILQNLALMAEAFGLGAFPFFAAHPYGWTQALGFRMENLRFSDTIGASALFKTLIRLAGKDQDVPTAIGFEHDGRLLLKPYCPPYYRSMEEAVRAFIDDKFATSTGSLRANGRWKDASISSSIPRPSERTIEATIAHCEYIYRRYGRYPAGNGPFRTCLAFQVHRIERDFYQRFYDEVP